jgi:hypothetical protein
VNDNDGEEDPMRVELEEMRALARDLAAAVLDISKEPWPELPELRDLIIRARNTGLLDE